MSKNNFLRILSFFIFPASVFIFSEFIAIAFNAYQVYPWIDIPIHFLGGFAIAYMAILFFRFFKEKNLLDIKNKAIFVLLVVALVVFIAVLWEFYQFLKFYFFGFVLSPLQDALLDFFMGLSGGLVGGIVFRKV